MFAYLWISVSVQNVLQHEASVLDDPRDARAWFSLGIRQQENERDDQAIHALLQGIRLEPSLREAYLALAVSYANEGDLMEAHNVLEKWISIFENAGEEIATHASPRVGKMEKHETLANTLMEMARMAPHGDIDADIQIALGVLFNASEVSSLAELKTHDADSRDAPHRNMTRRKTASEWRYRPDKMYVVYLQWFKGLTMILIDTDRTGCYIIDWVRRWPMAENRSRLCSAMKRR
jgi:tetratricopeptide (TPR) repeat protein